MNDKGSLSPDRDTLIFRFWWERNSSAAVMLRWVTCGVHHKRHGNDCEESWGTSVPSSLHSVPDKVEEDRLSESSSLVVFRMQRSALRKKFILRPLSLKFYNFYDFYDFHGTSSTTSVGSVRVYRGDTYRRWDDGHLVWVCYPYLSNH